MLINNNTSVKFCSHYNWKKEGENLIFDRCMSKFHKSNCVKKDESIVKIKESYPNVIFLDDTKSKKFPQKVRKMIRNLNFESMIIENKLNILHSS